MKMRKTSTVLTVVAIVLAVLSIGVLLFTPAMLGDRLNNLKDYSGAIIATPAYLTGNILKGELPGIIDVWLGKAGSGNLLDVCVSFFEFGKGTQPWLVMQVIGLVCIVLPVVILILHLILVFARRRPAAFVKTILYLVFGGVLAALTVSYLAYNYLFHLRDIFGVVTANKDNLLTCFVLLLPFVLAAAGIIVYTIGMIVSIADVCANPGLVKKTNAAGADSMGHTTPTSEEPLKYEDLTNIEYHQLGAGNPGLGTHGGHGPMIVQYISYAGLPGQQQPAAPAPAPAPEPKPEPKPEPAPAAMTPSYVGQPTVTPIKICDEGEYHAEPKPEPKPEPAPEPAKDDADRPITAKELRKIIRDALEDHEHPEENEPLTDGSARKIIQDELAAYYGIEEEEDEPTPEPAPATEPEPAPEPEHRLEDDYDILSADELRDIIRQEIEAAIPAAKEGEEAAPAEPSETDKRLDAIHEELRSLKESYMAPKEEEKAEPAAEEAPEEKEAALTADEVRTIIKEEIEASAKEEKPAADLEEARYRNQQARDARQDDAIASIRDALIKPEELRTIVAQELDKRLSEIKVEEAKPEPKPEPQPEPEPEPAPVEPITEPEPEPAPVAPIVRMVPPAIVNAKPAAPTVAVPKEKIIRIPFPERLLASDKDLLNNYNELKSEALSYGLKSRVSNTGDTFRLHTKTYLKITVAGKSLKIYYALKPSDYATSPIPVQDASGKNIYKEIPVCFKVKSPLSLRRAKQLIADVCEHDNLEQGKVVPNNWAAELKDYKPTGAGDDDDGSDDE